MNRLKYQIINFGKFAGQTVTTFTNFFVIIILAWSLLHLFPGDRWLLVRLGNYLAPWFLMGLIPVLLAALLKRRWRMAALTLAALALITGHSWPTLISPAQPLAQNQDSILKVMTFNVHYSNRNVDEIAAFIRLEEPDIVALQEITLELAGPLQDELAAEYPYYTYDNSWGYPLGLLSRYPLQTQPHAPGVQRSIEVVIDTPEGPVTVWNVHPFVAVDRIGWQSQQRTFETITSKVDTEQQPVIILGDFNATTISENYRLIAHHLTDVQAAAGRGFGFTFPENDVLDKIPWVPWYVQLLRIPRPFLRIDHILVSRHFAPLDTYVVPNGFGSDHRPVVATLQFNFE